MFNNFFTGVANELKADIPAINIGSFRSLFNSPVSVEECTNVISKLKNTKTGFIQFPVNFYKSLEIIHSPVIPSIANCCFVTGTFPE